MPRHLPPLAATLTALLAATAPLSAPAAPDCAEVNPAAMSEIRHNLDYAKKWMLQRFGTRWLSGNFDCYVNSSARQACTTAREFSAMAAERGVEILREATASGCYSCVPGELWSIAYELDDIANLLWKRHFEAESDVLLTELLRNQVNGVTECSAGTGQGGQTPLTPFPNNPVGQSLPAPLAPPPAGDCSQVDAYADARLNSGFGWVLDNLTLPQCVTTCAGESTCTGYDYNADTAQCVIRSEPMTQTGLEAYPGWTHFECN